MRPTYNSLIFKRGGEKRSHKSHILCIHIKPDVVRHPVSKIWFSRAEVGWLKPRIWILNFFWKTKKAEGLRQKTEAHIERPLVNLISSSRRKEHRGRKREKKPLIFAIHRIRESLVYPHYVKAIKDIKILGLQTKSNLSEREESGQCWLLQTWKNASFFCLSAYFYRILYYICIYIIFVLGGWRLIKK